MGTATARLQGRLPYVRFIAKCGKWQARPYCSVEKERYNLGLFPTEWAAGRAIETFWRTSKGDRSKFSKPVRRRDGSVRYRSCLTINLGEHDSPEAATEAVRAFLLGRVGKEMAEAILSRREVSRASDGVRNELYELRRRTIVCLSDLGVPAKEIAGLVGISAARVQEIIGLWPSHRTRSAS